MRKSTEKVRTAAETARPYVERAITDDEFRDSLRSAFVAAKEITRAVPPRTAGLASKVAGEDVQRASCGPSPRSDAPPQDQNAERRRRPRLSAQR
jgi:hypothetical protein